MTHREWPDVENSYQQKFIERFLNEFPELEKETIAITEKLHGANLQIFFEPNKPWKVGRRTAFLRDDEKFFGIHAVLPEYQPVFECVQEHGIWEPIRYGCLANFVALAYRKALIMGKESASFSSVI